MTDENYRVEMGGFSPSPGQQPCQRLPVSLGVSDQRKELQEPETAS